MAKELGAYKAKRNFAVTAEPSGEAAMLPSAQRRFVIQKHDATRLHYDLRLELDGVFKSWAVTRGPSRDPRDKRLAVEVEDHPLDYGDFEGTIPKGQYGGGTVLLWDRGYWEPEGSQSPEAMLARGDFKFVLSGERLRGSWVLVRIKDRKGGGKRINWLLIKHRDHEAVEENGAAVLEEERSVASGRTLADIAAGRKPAPKPFMTKTAKPAKADAVWMSNRTATGQAEVGSHRATPRRAAKAPAGETVTMPDFVPPQLCTNVDRPPSGAGWAHEVKFDGYRVQVRTAGGRATIRTRNGHDWTERFAAVAAEAGTLPDVLVDGEMVALAEDGTPSFPALQAALAEEKTDRLLFYAFDLLFVEGEDLRERPLVDRKARLKSLVESAALTRTRFVDHVETGGEALLASARKLLLEGIVSKRLDAPYVSGRSDRWRKAKCRPDQDVLLGGWTTTGSAFRSLLVGNLQDGKLVYLGRVGTGFAEPVVMRLLPRLKALTVTTSPFQGTGAPRGGKGIHWLKPDLVAKIECGGMSSDGLIRQGAFKGLREDTPATDLGGQGEVEAAGPDSSTRPKLRKPAAEPKTPGRYAPRRDGRSTIVMGVAISHAEKPMWPDAGDGVPVTKRDLALYFEAVGAWLMPHVARRPCSIVRAPDGFASEQFFQRHAMANTSDLLSLMTISGDRKAYLAIDRIEGLAAVAQVAALELHPSNCAAGSPEVPGRLVFDLDPGPDVPFATVADAAHTLREQLDGLGLVGFCKTTGGKGLHVVTPLAVPRKGGPDWPAAKAFAQTVCAVLARREPTRYVVNMAKKQRVGRIYLDYLRNDRLSTAVAPLSPRARPGATVSMPVLWEEVAATLDPRRFTLRTVPALLAESRAWADYEQCARPLGPAIRKLAKG